MRVVAVCTKPSIEAVRKAAGVEPISCPPIKAETWDYPGYASEIQRADIIYFRLHGLPMIPTRWFGEDDDNALIPALRLEQIQGWQLSAAPVVIVANCYGAESPMAQAFYTIGARAVIVGGGPNYAGTEDVYGADLLAHFLIIGLKAGNEPAKALQMAKLRLLPGVLHLADRDALEFKILEKSQ